MNEANVHAGCVALGGRGVLIVGPSGSGKSDLALRLVDRGAILVSDDYTLLRRDGERLLAAPPPRIAGRIEVRGVGIISLPFASEAAVALVVDLGLAPIRLPEPSRRELIDVAVPVVALNGLEPSAPIKVEAALASYGLPSPCPP